MSGAGTGTIVELNWYGEDSPFGGPHIEGSELDHLAFALTEGLAQRGHPVVHGPVPGRGAPWADVKDTNGIWLEIYERPRGSP